MKTRFAKQAPPEEKPVSVEAPFTPDGQLRSDGSVRYKILCDGGIHPSGVFWSLTVPPGASKDDYLEAQAERDEYLRRLAELAAT